ncbi:hypothetical protein [Brevibacillus porteri]|uniref:Uncharacterized protein n=1 Tax=Brevibacillus porteri TaxID=2126350 RepID=A0ABX5FRJ7_9BACL|nr:hypothetical protein [Brevibacillus porteri]MED1800506.1 hypothetical protein [Brevibacillus porteri]MED2132689.1 hypothetical protein [Brevibacillus porteri]MED2743302.1 hypothetical protein [Brevibacillus porteri]MED2816172.1 hypothetical protein [Brevibacillus porteri]MED2894014.1 hypothetical protein [Brevibacillus porteri]
MRKWVRGPMAAATFAFLILMMNLFPMVGLAASIQYQGLQYEAPKWDQPNLESPQWEQLNPQAPQWEQINPQAPDWEKLNPQAPSWDRTNPQAPNWDRINPQAPDLQGPSVNHSNPQAPNATAPAPNVQMPASQQPGVDPDSSKPMTETLEYGAVKWTFKDVMGGTLAYSADLLMNGEVDMAAGLRGKGLFLGDLAIKGLDLAFKNTPYVNTVTGLGVDSLDGMNAWANYQFVLAQLPNNSFRDIFQGGQLTNSANPSGVRMPGIVKGLNVGVAAISLPFDIMDTIGSFGMAFDPSQNEATQNEKFVDGVGNFGSVLMDGGVIASIIPGGQAVGGVLVVTGAVLWGLSKLVKYADKLAGGAITRGIRDGVGKAVGWVKSLFG